jgi:hypothetical protein
MRTEVVLDLGKSLGCGPRSSTALAISPSQFTEIVPDTRRI